MKNYSKKRIMSTLAILLIALMATGILALPSAVTAQTATAAKTYPFVEAIPNPVGVGQRTLINFGLLNFLMTDGDGWNVTLTITDPSGHVETIERMTWSTGTVGYSFVPETVGNYTLVCSFKASWYNSTYVGFMGPASISQYMASSETEPYMLEVTEAAAASYPAASMPTEYWTRPIDSQLREWWSIAGSWLKTPLNLYAPYNDAPETAHILWNMDVGDTAGGLMGGDSGDHGYGIGDAYEGKFSGSVIIDGKLYYNKMGSPFYSTVPTQEVVCVDLHTGKILWSRNLNNGGNLRISFGQNLYWDCLNYRGGFSYLFASTGSTLMAFETETGNWVFNYTNVPSGTNYWGPNGEFLQYSIVNYGNSTNPNFRLLRWNSSYVAMHGRTGMAESWGSAVQGMTFDARQGYDLNVSIAASPVNQGSIIYAFPGDRVIGGNVSTAGVTLWGLNLKAGSEGNILFSNFWAAPSDWKDLTVANSIGQAGWTAFSPEDLVATYWTKENRQNYAFSLETGKYLWVTDMQDYKDAWSDTVSLTFGPDKIIAYNKLISASVAGVVYCYDIQTGETLWTFDASDKYTESYLGNTWWLAPLFASDGKVYFGTLEHSALDPKPRGGPFIALDVETGALVFEADGLFRQTRWGGRAIMGDSIIATMDTYNQQIYGVGKGPSAMTVTAPNTAVTANTPIIIQGKVTDISPGTQTDALKMRFPNGVPAVADASQSEWMLYVYKQFDQPTNASGVPVSIDAVDPNGNYVHLGDATSDSSGNYMFAYTPSTAGQYTIYATFGGSAAYYSSYAQTGLVVQSVAATPTPTPVAQTPYEMYTIGMGIAIIIAIAIVGLLLLRKHP